MDWVRLTPITELQADEILEAAGGRRAHPEADRRTEVGSDYVLGDAVIEFKSLDDEGLTKPERQQRLAALFRAHLPGRPVVVLDPEQLPEEGQREYDRIMETPIKQAVSKARKQLKQSRAELNDVTTTVLWVINNGYTALDHASLLDLVVHRVRQDTSSIDGVVVAGAYIFGDGFDSHVLFPIDYVPINPGRPFNAFDALRAAWDAMATRIMTALVQQGHGEAASKGAVIDLQFDLEGVTYVKPAPPIGTRSDFYRFGRPRKNSTGITTCPPVAATYPALDEENWQLFRHALPQEPGLFHSYAAYQVELQRIGEDDAALQPVVLVPVTYWGWQEWREAAAEESSFHGLRRYANALFQTQVQAMIQGAAPLPRGRSLPSRFILVSTQEIGQDRANDLSHIQAISADKGGAFRAADLVVHERIFHEHALALGAAYAVRLGVSTVFWVRDNRYVWA